MNYAKIKKMDVADGPGVRVSLFVSGCTHHCKGCFNRETWDFEYGQPYTDATIEEILEALEPTYVQGFTALGGEPFEPENQGEVLKTLKAIREKYPTKDIWCYTGYTLESDIFKWIEEGNETAREMLECIDVLIDGEFEVEKRNLMLKFRGSDNQRLIDVKKTLATGKTILMD